MDHRCQWGVQKPIEGRERERGREWEREKAVEEEKKSEMVGRSRSDVRAGKGSQRGESINAKQSFELTSPLPLLLKPPIVFLLAHAPHVTLHCSTNGALTPHEEGITQVTIITMAPAGPVVVVMVVTHNKMSSS